MVRYLSVILIIVLVTGMANAQNKKAETIQLALSGLTCGDCVAKVDKALRAVKGVKDVKVDLKKESAEVILASAALKPEILVQAVVKAGYKARVGPAPIESDGMKGESCCSDEAMKGKGDCEGDGCGMEVKQPKKTKEQN